ncbi:MULTISPECIES: class I SAM-dependent methyltransferase [Kitasatospora]|uniref:class I SAM-dependent methyltransferase n=1 Tax=Kitasatospora TaxID=2063 RepID=UPI000B03BAFF|nr:MULTISPECIES: class I SAM-dependent methyltransferase [unclassified Kitasatospora]WAL73649.1 class I SAM-dependent methyltransferase [Kitasatospora sp. YST-16]WNW39707.1 class I SAM-dependent methyltransferase [Streptomyces sp. Li-HN-5-13]
MTDEQTAAAADADRASAAGVRRAERARQAAVFDTVGARYQEVFPARAGQLACGDWLLAELPAGARVLDVGCGAGEPTARQLAGGGLRVTGVDLSEGMLAQARAAVPGAGFHRMDVLDLGLESAGSLWGVPELGPDGNGSLDAATAFFSLLMLPRAEIAETLGRIRGLLRPGGLLALGMVEADLDDAPLPFLEQEIRVSGYLREELSGLLERGGFAVEAVDSQSYAPAGSAQPPETQLYLRCRRTG